MSQLLTLAPPGRIVLLPGRGEIFVRDSGEASDKKGAVLLLHGWMFGADLNWITCYLPLQEAGYRVIAVDHRGHGRGIRTGQPFRLVDCADDCAALLEELGTGPALVVGYSMGGAIAQLLVNRHPGLIRGLVLSATTDQWRDHPRMRMFWRTMRMLRFALTHTNRRFWYGIIRRNGTQATPEIMDWMISELERNDAHAIAEAGREMGRFDSRPWIGELGVRTAVICPQRDHLVPPDFQRSMAAHIPGSRLYEVAGDHVVVGRHPERYVPILLDALGHVSATDAQLAATGT